MVDPTSVLFVTLDSCRFDTFEAADAPNLKAVGPLHRTIAPGNFTYSSHAAMFMGFTPGDAELREPYVNPKYAKIFKIAGAGFPGKGPEFALLGGDNIVNGLRALGYVALGAAGLGWFNPSLPTGRVLTRDFDRFFFEGPFSLPAQTAFLREEMERHPGRPVFAFVNVAETHVPYFHDGAPWDPEDNLCVPFGERNDADACRRRQRACVEYADEMLAPLLGAFGDANIVICSDHGDAWGEDGLWEHGFHHPKVLEVPLLFHLPHPPPRPAELPVAPDEGGS